MLYYVGLCCTIVYYIIYEPGGVREGPCGRARAAATLRRDRESEAVTDGSKTAQVSGGKEHQMLQNIKMLTENYDI